MKGLVLGALCGAMMLTLAAPAGAAQQYVRVHETVTTRDGVELDGWVWRPVGAGRVPTVLFYSPYNGNFGDAAGNSDWAGNRPGVPVGAMAVVPTQRLQAAGYAIAFFSIPGTGNSGGCYDYFGRRTARAGAELVSWISRQSWSNHRVGLTGMSADATTTWAVATEAPAALKVIVPMHGIADFFAVHGTPNGLLGWSGGATAWGANWGATTGPTFNGPPDDHVDAPVRGVTRDRLCEDVERALDTTTLDPARAHRDAAFWSERRWTDRFSRIRAAVLSETGFTDANVGGFGPDAIGWPLLEGPKAMIQGQLGHLVPATVKTGDWIDVRMRWFDHYLRGVGPAPEEVGHVHYESEPGRWESTTSWPPAEARDEVHRLGREETLRPLTRTADNYVVGVDATPCSPGTVLYTTPAATADTTLAGVPFAYLDVSSDRDGGQVGVHLFELDRGFSCQGNAAAARLITWGAADLRFLDDTFVAAPFGGPRGVRVDMETAAARIEAGHRVGVVLSAGDVFYRAASTHLPELTLHGDSHVVLPVVGPSLGGAKPAIDYPPRPNLPR